MSLFSGVFIHAELFFHQYDGLAIDMNETDTLTDMEIHVDWNEGEFPGQ